MEWLLLPILEALLGLVWFIISGPFRVFHFWRGLHRAERGFDPCDAHSVAGLLAFLRPYAIVDEDVSPERVLAHSLSRAAGPGSSLTSPRAVHQWMDASLDEATAYSALRPTKNMLGMYFFTRVFSRAVRRGQPL